MSWLGDSAATVSCTHSYSYLQLEGHLDLLPGLGWDSEDSWASPFMWSSILQEARLSFLTR